MGLVQEQLFDLSDQPFCVTVHKDGSEDELHAQIQRALGLPRDLYNLEGDHVRLNREGLVLPAVRVHRIFFDKEENEMNFLPEELSDPRPGDLVENIKDSYEFDDMEGVFVLVPNPKTGKLEVNAYPEESGNTLIPAICASTLTRNFNNLLLFAQPPSSRHKVYVHTTSFDMAKVTVSGHRVRCPFRNPHPHGFDAFVFMGTSDAKAHEFMSLLTKLDQRFRGDASNVTAAITCFVPIDLDSSELFFDLKMAGRPEPSLTRALELQETTPVRYVPRFNDDVLASLILSNQLARPS